ncbi:MAG: hypothetical protein IMW92_14910, partial [Bacillales bacterium]|nr:hypothetical protein [Bacillales bacterium]
MDYFLTFVISIFEWIALLTFPVVLLGDPYRIYIKPILILSGIMSIVSLLLRFSPLETIFVIAVQMILLLCLVKWLFKVNALETLVISSIGYGFYSFIQLLITEVVKSISTNSYFKILFSFSDLPFLLRTITFLFVLSISYLLKRYQYHLTDFRLFLKTHNQNHHFRAVIIINSLLTFLFICLSVIAMLTDRINSKFSLVLYCVMILFVILFIYIILHTQFQAKHIIEAKKFYLDQEEQTALIVEKLKTDYEDHFHAILKLCERESSTLLIKEYLENNRLIRKKTASWLVESDFRSGLENLDELLYAFLVNKRKLAELLEVAVVATAEIHGNAAATLKQVRFLSMIMDDFILTLYQSPSSVEKKIYFHVQIGI